MKAALYVYCYRLNVGMCKYEVIAEVSSVFPCQNQLLLSFQKENDDVRGCQD